jgi:RNA polymerase sigma factor (sigma-70 family)
MAAAEVASCSLDPAIQAHLGYQLRTLYGRLPGEPLPDRLHALVTRLEAILEARGSERLEEFRTGILRTVPNLRAFGISLTGSPDRADDLVQETLLRAWSHHDRFAPGTNLEAWLFTILRNAFFSELRKRKREEEDPGEAHALSLAIAPDQTDRLEMQDLQEALRRVPADQREALWLVAVEGMTYDEAAAVCGCATGTIKSRVNRARNRLAELMGYDSDDIAGRYLHSS